MPIRSLLFFLILGLHCFIQLTPINRENIVRQPQSVAFAPTGGVYYLANGTDGCPSQIEWRHECGGFILTPSQGSFISEPQHFCAINRGDKVKRLESDHGSRKIKSTVVAEENMVRRTLTTIYSHQGESLSLRSEDTLIHDETGKLLWEHSENNRGVSCLFSK